MKTKNVLSLMILLMSFQLGFGQSKKIKYPYFEASVGVGMVPTFVKDQIQTELPPILLRVDYRLSERYSIGLLAGRTKVRTALDLMGDGDYEQLRNKFSMIGARFAVHSVYFKKWDLSGGMNFAYSVSDIEVIKGNITQLKKHLNFKPVSGRMMMSAFLGAKYLIKPNTTLFGEVGYGISLLSIGVSRKL